MESWIQDPMWLAGLERLIWLLAVGPAAYLALLLSRWMTSSLRPAERREG